MPYSIPADSAVPAHRAQSFRLPSWPGADGGTGKIHEAGSCCGQPAILLAAEVTAAILSVEGVVNAAEIQLNGSASDLILTETGAAQQVPVLGTVTLHE